MHYLQEAVVVVALAVAVARAAAALLVLQLLLLLLLLLSLLLFFAGDDAAVAKQVQNAHDGGAPLSVCILWILQHVRRTMVCQILGMASAGVTQKFGLFVKALAQEVRADDFDARRESVCGWLADQGVDLSVGDCPHASSWITWSKACG
jgi:hypothetical protein